jgi:large subunit ribosomal protein L2
MPIKKFKPTSAGRRISSGDAFADVTKSKPTKRLTWSIKKNAGRNNQGRITVRHRGGGAKRRYRMVDFRQERFEVPATVLSIEYDPNRSARIALIDYGNGDTSYILAADGMQVGQTIITTHKTTDVNPGNRMRLGNMPTGTLVHNVELFPDRGGAIVRSAGSSAIVMSQDSGIALLKLSSGEVRKFDENCMASVGTVSNPDWGNIRWGKAGRMRYRGIRPRVRGKVMNPVDHPHGGGEGNQPIGMKYPKTPQGKHALGVRTRRKKKFSNKYIMNSRKKR